MLDVLERYGITNVRVFGSIARGEDDEASDVDLLVDVPSNLGTFALIGAEREVSEVLRRGCRPRPGCRTQAPRSPGRRA